MAIVTLRDVSVNIPIYNFGSASLRKLILGKTIGGRFGRAGSHVTVNALKTVSFEAHEGDRIGLVGQNGSGKTTLLRVLAGVYVPTSGTIDVQGDIVPMLDTMLGMAEDATGFENIRLCGALWGLSYAQIEASVPEIMNFTELGEYMNMPIRTYSAGMKLRLAFAIATVRQPEILLLDEVIGVGDAVFYRKAFARLLSVVQNSRVLFVASHSREIIERICNKAVWMHQGSLASFGDVKTVLEQYESAATP